MQLEYHHISKRGNGSLTEYVTEIDDKKLLFQLATAVSVAHECICTISASHGDI
jgi:hypothetical protein